VAADSSAFACVASHSFSLFCCLPAPATSATGLGLQAGALASNGATASIAAKLPEACHLCQQKHGLACVRLGLPVASEALHLCWLPLVSWEAPEVALSFAACACARLAVWAAPAFPTLLTKTPATRPKALPRGLQTIQVLLKIGTSCVQMLS